MRSCNMLVRGWGRVFLCTSLHPSTTSSPPRFTHRLATVADASHRILKRRLAWLIGEWVSSDEECAKLPLVWQILVHLLSERGESSDMAVRLTAAIAFKNCVDVRPPPECC
jgi:hypothetical protein